MTNSRVTIPTPYNEPIRNYLPDSLEKLSLKTQLQQLGGDSIEIPLIIGGKNIKTDELTSNIKRTVAKALNIQIVRKGGHQDSHY